MIHGGCSEGNINFWVCVNEFKTFESLETQIEHRRALLWMKTTFELKKSKIKKITCKKSKRTSNRKILFFEGKHLNRTGSLIASQPNSRMSRNFVNTFLINAVVLSRCFNKVFKNSPELQLTPSTW